MSYQPQPGTIAARVLNWLRLQPRDYCASSAVLAEELGVLPGNIQPSLVAAVRQGAVAMEKVDGLLYWSLGDGTPLPRPLDQQDDEPLHPLPSIPTTPALPLPSLPLAQRALVDVLTEQGLVDALTQESIPARPASPTRPPRKARAQPVTQPAPPALPSPLPPLAFAVGLQMHGGLLIECDGRRLELSDSQTRFLQRLLRAMEVTE